MFVRALCCALVWMGSSGSASADTAALFRLFLTDGSSVVTYGEFSRVGDRVVFSMVLGDGAAPHLHAATLPASAIDWARTDQHAVSTRHQWYAQTRAEEDYSRLNDDVAALLNQIGSAPDPGDALAYAQRAREMLAEWPRSHYGYRQQDVQEILSFLDEVISGLQASAGVTSFEVALVAPTPDVTLEPLAILPTVPEQVDAAFRVAALTQRPAERVALMQAVLQLLAEPRPGIDMREMATWRRAAASAVRAERVIDERYGEVVRRLMTQAHRFAAAARIGDVERVLAQVSREDARLGHLRPDIVQALRASLQAELDAARHLRLLRDRWQIRVSLYRDYERRVGAQLLQLVKSQPALEAIRRLDGPAPDHLQVLQVRLRGGAERLAHISAPIDMAVAHDLLIGAWRLAEAAVIRRYEAARAADVTAAWEASSTAAGALLLLSRVQQEIRDLLEPPVLQ